MAGWIGGELVGSSLAWADGAFPDAQSVLLPRDRPRQIILGTTFGLVFSDDDGATWSYACENPGATQMGSEYSMGPPPDDRIYAVSTNGAPVSADNGCTWRIGGGALVGTVVTDVFPDPSDPKRVFAVAIPAGAEPAPGVFRSADGGLTYSGPIWSAAVGATITGVEVAASDPGTVYVTVDNRVGGLDPVLARSRDGGDTWTTHSLEAALGAVTPRLIAVDPADPARVFLRLIGVGTGVAPVGEALAVTVDGGDSWTTPLTLTDGNILGFARLPSGVLVAAGNLTADQPSLFRSQDGGASFAPVPVVGFHPKGLAARGGALFVAANNFVDPFALASTDDEGTTWKPRLKFSDISAVRACVQKACLANCEYLAGLTLFPKAACADRSTGSGCGIGSDEPALGMAALLLFVGVLSVRVARRRK